MEFNRSTSKKTCTSLFFALIILALVTMPVLASATWPIFRLKWGTANPGGVPVDGSFSIPVAIEATADRVYVADSVNNRVQIFTRDGTFVSKIGPNFDGDGGYPLRVPQGVAVDSAGNIYIADTLDRVLKFNSSLVFQVKTGAIGLFSPSGLAVSPDGATLFVTDTYNNRIVKLNTSDLTVATGSPIGTGLNLPKDVAINTAGSHIFVADTGNNRLVKIPVGGGAQTNSAISLNQPHSIAIDSADNIYVTNTNANTLLKLTSAMVLNKSWGSAGSGDGQVQYPKGITALGEDEVYLADTNNNRIQYFEFNQPMTDITLSAMSIMEGNSSTQEIGTLTTTDPNPLDKFTYQLVTDTRYTCTDNTTFTVSGNSLRVNNKVFDFETKSSYSICVKVLDSNSQNNYVKPFTITILDGPDAPSVTSQKVYGIVEYTTRAANTTNPTLILNPVINVIDNDDNDDMTFSIVGGTFADAFEVVKASARTANLKVKDNGATPPAYQTLLDYETAPVLTNPANNRGGTVIVRITDSKPAEQPRNSKDEIFTITLSNQYDPPVINFPAGAFEVDELAPVGTVVGPAGVDCTPSPTPAACLITITDQDTVIGSLTLSLEPTKPSDYFAIQKVTHPTQSLWKVVTKAALPNHFTTPSVDFYLQATDGTYGAGTTNTVKKTLPIAITDSNNAPELLDEYEMHEDRKVGYVLELATDADINDILTYEILDPGNTADTFEVVGGKIQIKNEALIDYLYWQNPALPLPYLHMNVRVYDDAEVPLEDSGWVIIRITEGNRPPAFEGTPTLTTPESTASSPLGADVVGTIKVIDPDNDPEFSYLTITSPADGPFVVNKECFAPCTANVTVNTAQLNQINYETAPSHALSITVTISDGVDPAVTQTFPVILTNINEPITIDNASTPISVHDRWEAGHVVGTVAWTDEDGNANTQPIFSLAGEGAEHFEIDPSSGQIKILPTANLHYYLGSLYRPTIVVRDMELGGLSDSRQFTINLIDDNDPPSFKAFEYATAPTNSLAENQPNGTVVGSFVVFDENGQDFSVAINGGNGAYGITTEAMDPVVANGKTMIHKRVTVSIADTTKIDYDTAENNQSPLSITGVELATTPLTGAHTYNIALSNVNEAPVIQNQQLFTYQDAGLGVVVGTLAASDPDANTTLTYTIVNGGTASAFFEMTNPNNGVITVKRRTSQNLDPGNYTMTVRVIDNGQPTLPSGDATITITVTPKADPMISSLTVPANELLIGSALRYNITVSNNGGGVSSTYKLRLKLPVGVGFELPGSTTGCAYITADTVECPGAALQAKGTAGDTANFVINAYLFSSARRDVSLTANASLVLTATLNDLDTGNNLKNVAFTTRKSIIITDQTFESLDPQNFTVGGIAASKTTAPAACVASPQSFAGLLSNDTLQYNKTIISHSKVEVSFDLYLAYTWDGVGSDGPDRWKFCKGNCQTPADFFLDTTFSNMPGDDNEGVPLHPQSYPDAYVSGARYGHDAFTGSAAVNTLGYYTGGSNCSGEEMNSVYSLRYVFDHADPNLILKFIGEGLQSGALEEKWGIDNFRVIIYGEDSYDVFLPSVVR